MSWVFKCPKDGCSKLYNRKDNLLQHIKKDHQIPATKCGRFKCHVDTCQQCYFHRTELIKHLRTEHDLHIGEIHCVHTLNNTYTIMCTCSSTMIIISDVQCVLILLISKLFVYHDTILHSLCIDIWLSKYYISACLSN